MIAFVLFLAAGALFITERPVSAATTTMDACPQFGDEWMGTIEENCYPDDPTFCFDGDNYCWQIAPSYSCENWYGICWDNANPCQYYCCCRLI